MTMLSPESIQKELRLSNLSPNKLLGQHFLLDEAIPKEMVAALNLDSVDTLIEVGPGLGILTERLIETKKRIIAIEKDRGIASALVKKFKGVKNIEVINQDILTFRLDTVLVKNERYSIVANLPYNITARFLKQFLADSVHKPIEVVVMIQKEVADRLCAKAGDLSKIGILAQLYSTPKIIIPRIPPESFFPEPEVDSSIIALKITVDLPHIFPQYEDVFWRLVRIGFSSKRKKLTNNLAAGLVMKTQTVKEMLTLAGISESVRAEDVSIDAWVKMVDIYVKNHCR